MNEPTFNLTLEDAEFVVEELPQRDDFTRQMREWCIAERQRRDDEEERRAYGPGVVFRFGANGLPKMVVEPAPEGGWPR